MTKPWEIDGSCGKAPLNITDSVRGFGYASIHMRVHSFLPLEDTEDKNNGGLLRIVQAVCSTASANLITKLMTTVMAVQLTRARIRWWREGGSALMMHSNCIKGHPGYMFVGRQQVCWEVEGKRKAINNP